MSIILHSKQMDLIDTEGNPHSVDVLMDKSTEERLEDISKRVSQEKEKLEGDLTKLEQQIDRKVSDALASIPDSYQELNNKVNKPVVVDEPADKYTKLSIELSQSDEIELAEMKDVDEVKQDLSPILPFEEIGVPSTIFHNINVYGPLEKRYIITNINRDFDGFTGFVCYNADASGIFTSGNITVKCPNEKGHISFLFDDTIISLDYDLTKIDSGTRVTTNGLKHLISKTRYIENMDLFNSNVFKAYSGMSAVFQNARIIQKSNNHYSISAVRYNFSGSNGFAIYKSDAHGGDLVLVSNITLSDADVKGHYSSVYEKDIIEFDYDLTKVPSGTRITPSGDALTFKEDCYLNLTTYIPRTPSTTISIFKDIAVIGDSYASGLCYRTDGSFQRCWGMSWIRDIARKNGLNATNYSFPGLATDSWLTHERGLPKMLSETPKNLYILALGINDATGSGHGQTYLGSAADWSGIKESRPNTFYGNYSRIIEEVKAKAPNAKIIMSTMADNSDTLHKNFNNAIIDLARHYAIPCIKQYEDEYFSSSFYLNGMISGHPTAPTYSGMAVALQKMIEFCIEENFDYFKDFFADYAESNMN